jgi:hypothetical protein
MYHPIVEYRYRYSFENDRHRRPRPFHISYCSALLSTVKHVAELPTITPGSDVLLLL